MTVSTYAGLLARNDLVRGFRSLGVMKDDTLLVHSSFGSLGKVEGGVRTVVDALLASTGTLIVPTFNYGFCQGEPYDARTTPSQMGLLSEAVRRHRDARYVTHPVYSFAALGARAAEIGRIHNVSAFGADSLFGKLREWDAKIMVIGLSWDDSVTFFHHVEEMEGCDYRHMKDFTGSYTGLDGVTEERTYRILSRDLDKDAIRQFDPMGRIAEDAGIVQMGEIGDATVRVVGARALYTLTAAAMRQVPRFLVRGSW